MSIINLKILDPTREFFFLGDDILNSETWTPVETSDLSTDVKNNMLVALDAQIITSDMPIADIRLILDQSGGVTVVVDIAERDALAATEGQEVLVQDDGTGQWAKFKRYLGAWIEVDNQAGTSVQSFADLLDTDVAFSALTDGFHVKYDHTSGKLTLEEVVAATPLTQVEIATLYESNGNVNRLTDSLLMKLNGIDAGATANTTISADNVTLGIAQTVQTDVSSSLVELYTSLDTVNLDIAGRSLQGHDHDATYSQLGHGHAADYAPIVHSHAQYSVTTHTHAAYADLSHNHNADYSPLVHHHDARNDLRYADIVHDHDLAYANIVHSHDAHNNSLYSALGHDHSALYAPLAHHHNTFYESTLPTPAVDDQLLVKSSLGAYSFIGLDVLTATQIDDITPALDFTYSSSKIDLLLADVSPIAHNHDLVYATLGHDHSGQYYTKAESDDRDMTWGGIYTPGTPYLEKQLVSHSGSVFYGKSPSTNVTPIQGAIWDLVSAAPETPSGLLPVGGTAGQVLKKVSGTDFDTEWVTQGTTTTSAVVKLGIGASISVRLGGLEAPAGWTVSSGLTAAHPNFGNGADTLVIEHGANAMVSEISVWETATTGPLIAQGATRIDLTTQGQVKNSTDLMSCAVINLQGFTSSSKEVAIYLTLVAS